MPTSNNSTTNPKPSDPPTSKVSPASPHAQTTAHSHPHPTKILTKTQLTRIETLIEATTSHLSRFDHVFRPRPPSSLRLVDSVLASPSPEGAAGAAIRTMIEKIGADAEVARALQMELVEGLREIREMEEQGRVIGIEEREVWLERLRGRIRALEAKLGEMDGGCDGVLAIGRGGA